MFFYYLKFAVRIFQGKKLTTLINLFGLTVGFICSTLIFLYVSDQWSYDDFHTNKNLIYRLSTKETNEGKTRRMAHTYLPEGGIFNSQLPNVQNVVRFFPQSVSLLDETKTKIFQEKNFCFVDSNFLDMFSFPVTSGVRHEALSSPDKLLIHRRVVKKYFGDDDPVGKKLIVNETNYFKISGIIEDGTNESVLEFDFLAPMASITAVSGWALDQGKNWFFPLGYTFIQFQSKVDASNFPEQIKGILENNIPKRITKTRSYNLMPLSDLHFSSMENEPIQVISKTALFIYIGISILILCIAVFNFVNLAMMQQWTRVKSIGIQKVNGASPFHVFFHSFVENLLIFEIAYLFALLSFQIVLPKFNQLMGADLKINGKYGIEILLGMQCIVLVLSALLSLSLNELWLKNKITDLIKGLKNKTVFNTGISLKSAFIGIQFALTIVLIICTHIFTKQFSYIYSKDLGLNNESVVVLPASDEIQNNLQAVKNELTRISSVKNVSAISNFPWEKGFYDFETEIKMEGRIEKSNAKTLLVEEDFIQTLGLQVKSGRSFDKNIPTDISEGFIINESAANSLGIKDIENANILMNSVASGKPKVGKILGIVKDFHLQSLHEVIEPLFITVSPEPYYLDQLLVKFASGSLVQNINELKTAWATLYPNKPFEYFFLDEKMNSLYAAEHKFGMLFRIFAILAILISGLGLFGVSSLVAIQRSREIAIRKVLGADLIQLFVLLSRKYFVWIFIAFLAASPLAYFIGNSWLNQFAYRTSIEPLSFLFAGIIILIVVIITISYQTFNAVLKNPIDSVRLQG